jgi:BolA protein
MQEKIMNLTHDILREHLRQAFPHAEIEVEPESKFHLHLHRSHTGNEDGTGRFLIRVIDARFNGLHRIARHWLIYDAVCGWMSERVTALKIIPVTQKEVRQVLNDPFAALLFDIKYATNVFYIDR